MKRSQVKSNNDPSSVASKTYNEYAGSTKISDVGHKFAPLQSSTGVFTTDASTVVPVGAGKALAIYNDSDAIESVTTGDNSVVSQTVGAIQAGTPADLFPFIGIPCKPNDWTYINLFDHTHVVTSSDNCIVLIIKDDTIVTK